MKVSDEIDYITIKLDSKDHSEVGSIFNKSCDFIDKYYRRTALRKEIDYVKKVLLTYHESKNNSQ
jgi:hypothetical protein